MSMKTRNWLAALAVIAASQSDVYGLTPPSESDGPIKLLGCIVSPQGVLEAEVDSQVDDDMNCNIRCNYEIAERMFSYTFSVTIPKRFHGRVGQFNTSTARPGNYSGEVGTCKKN